MKGSCIISIAPSARKAASSAWRPRRTCTQRKRNRESFYTHLSTDVGQQLRACPRSLRDHLGGLCPLERDRVVHRDGIPRRDEARRRRTGARRGGVGPV